MDNKQPNPNEAVSHMARTEYLCHMTGWLLFVACAVLFVTSAAINRDWLTLAGSLLFLAACFFFLIPLWLSRPGSHESSSKRNGLQ